MGGGLLPLCTGLPVVELEPGEVLVEDGATTGSIWVLESGSLGVWKGGGELNRITAPGAAIGEVAAILGTAHGATVVAIERSRLRYAADAEAFVAGDPAVMRAIAVGLAERLNFVTSYLADLKRQYGEAPGLAMVNDVVSRLANLPGGPPRARPRSARDPDPEY